MIDRLLKSNNIVKIIAFFLALTLWIYVAGDNLRTNVQDVSRTITNVPLAYRNLNDRLELMEIPATIDIVLRGAADRVYDILPHEIEVYVNLQGLDEGRHRLTPNAALPRGIRMESFHPQQVTVEVEEVIMQQRKVSVILTGKQVDGWVVGEPVAIPDQIFVRGPRSVLDSVVEVNAEVDISGAEDNVIQVVPVRAVDHLGREVGRAVVNQDMVQVQVPVFLPQKDVPVKVSLEGEPAEGYRVAAININPGEVTVTGRESYVQAVSVLTTKTIDITGATESITREVELFSPEGVELSKTLVSVEIIIEEL
ncbi:MAG: hypothetical protein KGZ79_12180 [Dethiobacter sp.]|jgi:YbbR domain-containing protein|nr:hypothetical protein [Dethiobacter sp.]